MDVRTIPPSLVARYFLQPLQLPSRAAATAAAAGLQVPPLDVAAVYWRRNAPRVAALLQSFPQARPRLWALDGADERLSAWTAGVGPGTRMELLSKLCPAGDSDPDSWLLITDDDVRMAPRQLRLFIRTAKLAGLDVSQPAHLPRSYASWNFNRQQLGSVVRVTRFVESGPLVLFSPLARRECLPLPGSIGMGWGLEVHFARAMNAGLRLGIVDAAGMRHLAPAAMSYSRDEADRTGRRLLAEAGLSGFSDLQVVTARWPAWRRRPGWREQAPAGPSLR